MSRRTLPLNDTLYEYLLEVSLREPEVLRRLRAETARHPRAEMQIAPEQGQFMALLVRLIGARRVLEIGTFTGYSALWMALALPPDGRLVTCDVSAEYTAVARRYWEAAGVADRIELRLGRRAKRSKRCWTKGPPARLIWPLSMPIKHRTMPTTSARCNWCGPGA